MRDCIRYAMRLLAAAALLAATGCGEIPDEDRDLAASSSPLTLTSDPTQISFSNIAGKYRLAPTLNLLTEGGNRAVALGRKTQFIHLDIGAYPNGTAQGQTWTRTKNQAPAVQIQDPIFDAYLRRAELGAIVMTVIPGVGPLTFPTATDATYDPEYSRVFNLAKQLYAQLNGTGKTFVLKNWEGDWYLLELFGGSTRKCNNPLDASGIPVVTADADVACARNMIRFFRARQRAVADARAQFGGGSNVKVYHAVEVNQVQPAIAGTLRLAHLIPYIGPDLITYSSWDSTNRRGSYAEVVADLNAAFDFLMSQTAQRALTAPGGRLAGVFNEFPVQPADPLGLGSRRIAITEFGVAENHFPNEVDFRIQAAVDTSRSRNIFATYYWQLYDNECGAGGVNCIGYMLYRPDGTPSLALGALQRYAGFPGGTTGQAPPTNLHTEPAQPVFGGVNNLAWTAAPGATQYTVRVTPPSGVATTTSTPNTWYTLPSNSAGGAYSWTVSATGAAGSSAAVAGPPFSIVAGGTVDAAFVSQSVPTTLARGATSTVSIFMRNAGGATWTRAGGFKLGSQNPQDNVTWGTGRVELLATDSITSGQQREFRFTIRAPSTAGSYNFQWRMVQEGVQWFGAFTPNVVIQVTP